MSSSFALINLGQFEFKFSFCYSWILIIMCHNKFNPFELKSNQSSKSLWRNIENKVQIKLCPKIIKSFLLNAQYSLDHCKQTLSIYRATEKFKQFNPVTDNNNSQLNIKKKINSFLLPLKFLW